jgi:hypothetical protein
MPSTPRARSLLATALAVLVLASPVRLLWAHPSRGWSSVFVLWGGVLLLTAWVGRGPGGRDA